METEIIKVEKAEGTSAVLGHAGFIKTAEDLYEALMDSAPEVRFGLAFAEASGKRLVRTEGNDKGLEALAAKNMLAIGAGHTFLILFEGAYPINVVRHIKDVCEVVSIYCATANPIAAIVASEGDSRAVIGVMDGQRPVGIESQGDKEERRDLLRKIGYKK